MSVEAVSKTHLVSNCCVAPRSGIHAIPITLRCITDPFKMLTYFHTYAALFPRPAPCSLTRSEALQPLLVIPVNTFVIFFPEKHCTSCKPAPNQCGVRRIAAFLFLCAAPFRRQKNNPGCIICVCHRLNADRTANVFSRP